MGFKRRGAWPKRGYCKRCGEKRKLIAGGAIDRNGRRVVLGWAIFGACSGCGYRPKWDPARRRSPRVNARRVTLPSVQIAREIRARAKAEGKTSGEYLADLYRRQS